MKKEFFEKIYILDADKISKKQEDSFLMCGDRNWDYYFFENKENFECEEIENVVFYEFKNHEKENFKRLINNKNLIDFSQEKDKSYLLRYG